MKGLHLSLDWVGDIAAMHDHYKMTAGFSKITSPEMLKNLLRFRLDFIKEEVKEMDDAYAEGNAEEVIDALIDICVVAIGTLDAFGVDGDQAWDEVLKANMNKVPGIKESRPNPWGLPDLTKPEGWVAPSHADNHGRMDIAFQGPCDL